ADEPLRERRLPVQDLRPLRGPVEVRLRDPGPERLRVARRLGVELLVVRERLDVRGAGELRRRIELAILAQHGLDDGLSFAHGPPSMVLVVRALSPSARTRSSEALSPGR